MMIRWERKVYSRDDWLSKGKSIQASLRLLRGMLVPGVIRWGQVTRSLNDLV